MRSSQTGTNAHHYELVFQAFRAIQRASVRGYPQALTAVVREVKALVGTSALVSCMSLDHSEVVVGDVLSRQVGEQARRAAWDGGPLVLRPDDLPIRLFPIRAQLPGGDAIEHRFPIAVVLVEGETQSDLSLAHVEQLAELIGDTLLLAQDRVGAPQAFRRLAQRWVEVARERGVPLSVLAVALDGLDEINQTIGFEAGDGALGEAVAFLERELPHATALSTIGGAITAILLAGVGGDAALETAARLARAFGERGAASVPNRVSLSTGVATLGPDIADGELLRAARAALRAARQRREPVVAWTPALAAADPDDLLPDIDSVSGAEYQRIMAIWRLFEALCHGAQLDQLIAATLRALLPLFRADRVALWHQVDGVWARRTTIERSARTSGSPPVTIETRALIAAAAESPEIVMSPGVRMIAIGLRRADQVTGVLEVAHDAGALRTHEGDLGFLRTFARQVGQVIGEVQALTDARRQQQETADRFRQQTIELRRLVRTNSGLVGNHASMQAVFRMIERSRTSNFPLVITGETGTGKEAVARLVHRMSNRRGPFVVVDCGAIPGALLETELFGHEKGAFTGADSRKIGHFEEAHKGTIFLDEIGELPLELQPKLLRVLQESTVRRLGGREVISVDFRMIAATHRNLAAMVEEGTFRQDLYFRLRVLEIELPPLRDRGDDILLLALYSLRQYCAELGREMMMIAPDAEALMRAYSWPGNVRELQNVLRRAMLVAPGHELTANDLHLEVAAPSRALPRRRDAPPTPSRELPAPGALSEELEDAVARWFWHGWAAQAATASPPNDAIEAFLLRTCLRVSHGSISDAAKLLDMHPETFGSHLEKLGDPEVSRTIRHHSLGAILERSVLEADGELRDRILRVLLTELLVYCRGNKSEMARHLGWGRQTLGRQLRRLAVLGQSRASSQD